MVGVLGVVGVVGVAAGPQAATTRDSAIKPLTTSQSIFFICFASFYLKICRLVQLMTFSLISSAISDSDKPRKLCLNCPTRV
ncbi:MAG: hypothetical protein A2Z28_00195 [Chloroflexi bacterium RBG_16_51_9]|nr:MAG: hypothetical protein A2Z28_00195 [Chloroflexi bacterium RBG_16_51_9]